MRVRVWKKMVGCIVLLGLVLPSAAGAGVDKQAVMVVKLSTAVSQGKAQFAYCRCLADLPAGGVTNHAYRAEYLLLRKLPVGSFFMGEGNYVERVDLKKEYYLGVFKITRQQWSYIMGQGKVAPREALLPMAPVTYEMVRGAEAGSKWPESAAVDQDSFIGRLRFLLDNQSVDLPTEAQWEYAGRAGFSVRYSDGDRVEVEGWESGTQGTSSDPAQATGVQRVTDCPEGVYPLIDGLGTPNFWGIYDMHSEVYEWCLDWYESRIRRGVDPKGPAKGQFRVRRGGVWKDAASGRRSAIRSFYAPADQQQIGLRIVVTLDKSTDK